MGNTIARDAKRSNSFRIEESTNQIQENPEKFIIIGGSEKNKPNELIKSHNFRKGSSWSLGSLNQSSSLPGSVRSAHSVTSTRNKSTHRSSHKNQFYKTVWPISSKEIIFSSHFKRVSRNNEFSIVEVIAKGAFGIVFKVKTKDNYFREENSPQKQIYALKVLKKSKIIEENCVQQIKDEIDIQKICSHHLFIVKYIDSWQNRSNLHILLEYIPCGELFTKILNFPYELIQLYVAEIASALDFLHNAGIIYRDVKPENILLTSDLHIKLADFGLSKWLKFGEKTYTMCGTFQYMAPEILLGLPYGHSVDWWALGVVACRMFTKKYPNTTKLIEEKYGSSFHANHVVLTDNDALMESHQFLPFEIDAVRKEGKDVILRLLEYDPKLRLKSVLGLQKIAIYKDFKIEPKFLQKISPSEILKRHHITLNETENKEQIEEFKQF